MSSLASLLPRRRDMLAQGIRLLWGVWAVASVGHAQTIVLDAYGQPVTIRFAEGINAIGAYEGYKPLTAEAVVTAAADVIVLPARGLDSVGSVADSSRSQESPSLRQGSNGILSPWTTCTS